MSDLEFVPIHDSETDPADSAFRTWTYPEQTDTALQDDSAAADCRLWDALVEETRHVARVMEQRAEDGADPLLMALQSYFGEHVTQRYIDSLAPLDDDEGSAPDAGDTGGEERVTRAVFLRFLAVLFCMSLYNARTVDELYELAQASPRIIADLHGILPHADFIHIISRLRSFSSSDALVSAPIPAVTQSSCTSVLQPLEDLLAQCSAGLMPRAFIALLRNSAPVPACHSLVSALGVSLSARHVRSNELTGDMVRSLFATCSMSGNGMPSVVALSSTGSEASICAVLRARQQALACVDVIAPLRPYSSSSPFTFSSLKLSCDGVIVPNLAPPVTLAVGTLRTGGADVPVQAAALREGRGITVIVRAGGEQTNTA
eukprot:IDg16301t1